MGHAVPGSVHGVVQGTLDVVVICVAAGAGGSGAAVVEGVVTGGIGTDVS